MALFSTVEDHGAGLLEEYNRFVVTHGKRVEARAGIVVKRLASLESEHATLADLRRDLEAHKA
jgi:hypothetical protein